MSVNELLEQAKVEIENLNEGETFVLKELFKGYEWKRIGQGDKSTLGVLFLNYAQQNPQIIVTKEKNTWQYKMCRRSNV